jgi:hypothetical protein
LHTSQALLEREHGMPHRPTTYDDVHDEFYFPGAVSARERKPVREVGYEMGLRGSRVTREFLDDQAQLYHGRLNSALHTIDQRAHTVRRRSADFGRNLSLWVLAIGGFVILALALTVDYKILHDFWTTIYQNKFLQVPESLKDNVVFKSLQVLFAVIAIHFLISAPGVAGKAIRGTFMVAIGIMVIAMLIGLGFLAAKSTLPAGSTLFGHAVDTRDAAAPAVSNDAILQGLGLRPSSPGGKSAKAGSSADTGGSSRSDATPRIAKVSDIVGNSKSTLWSRFKATDFESAGTLVFFSTFTLIFLFVSSVGALCMHYSLKAFDALLGGVSPQHAEHKSPGALIGVAYWALGKGEWRPKTSKDLADERQRIFHAQRLIGEPAYREHLMSKFFAQYAAGYMEGLHARDSSPRKFMGGGYDELRDEMRTEMAEARADWAADAIAERIPDVELRRSLGYDPDARVDGGVFGFVSKMGSGQRARYGGRLVEDTRLSDEAKAARLGPPTRG